jgi:uncharacterized membrane protein YdjX (TVP38/TMEM64 family)
MKLGVAFRGVIVILTVVAVVAIVHSADIGYGPDELKRWADTEIRGHGLTGLLIFIAGGAFVTGIGLSRQLLSFAAGYAFGAVSGTGAALLAEIGGVILAFLYARFLGRALVARLYPGRVRRVDEFLRVNPFLMTLAIRLLPISNNLAVNLVAGVSSVRASPFLAASALGHIPQTVVFAMIGSGLTDGLFEKSAVAVVLFVVSVWIGLHLYRNYRRDKMFDPAIDAALDLHESADPPGIPPKV